MATIACPGCGLPRADELIEAMPCPVCGATGTLPLADAIPDGPAFRGRSRPRHGTSDSTPLELNPERLRGNRLGVGLFLGFALGIGAGVGGVFGWQAYSRSHAPVEVAAVGGDPTPPPGPPLVPPVVTLADTAPMPREVAARPVQPLASPPGANPGPAPAQVPPPVEPVPPGPAPMPQPPPPPPPVVAGPPPEAAPANPFRPNAPPVQLVKTDEFNPVLAPGQAMVCRGKVKILKVRGLEAGAVLDCSDLDAAEVIVSGKIDGGSKLWLKATSGKVTFLAKVDAKSTVGVYAPGGTVTFVTPTDPNREGSKIDGGATIDITAKAVQFVGRITGTGTKVEVTLTTGGSLTFAEIDGPSKLEYSKADPDDPDPAITRGKVGAPATVQLVE